MEWLDTDVGSMKPALQKAPEVFESVGMNRAVHVGHGMIDDLVRVFPFQSVIGFQFIAVERRASFHMLFHFALQSLFFRLSTTTVRTCPPRSRIPITATLFLVPLPVMRRFRCATCMFLAFPPMKVSSTSTSPTSFTKEPVCMALRIR